MKTAKKLIVNVFFCFAVLAGAVFMPFKAASAVCDTRVHISTQYSKVFDNRPYAVQNEMFSSDDYAYAGERLIDIIDGIIAWKKQDIGISPRQSLFTRGFLEFAGSAACDWYSFLLGRYNYSENYSAYLSAVEDYVSRKYLETDKLDRNKSTEWHRIALSIAAAGGNPMTAGEYNGAPIDLIADGTYNRGLTESPGRQGISGWIWGLISLDSKRFDIPDDAYYSRHDFITEILKLQLNDGGFALYGNNSEPDITGMAVQALSPYYDDETVYKYTSAKIKENGEFVSISKTVRQVVDASLAWLSSAQSSDGDFFSMGTQNSESTAWAMLAVLALNIDPLTDSRFIKNGKTLIDGIMKYRTADGGFTHSDSADSENPAALPGKSNSVASEQVLFGLVGLYRFQNGMNNLFDLRDAVPEASCFSEESAMRADYILGLSILSTEYYFEVLDLKRSLSKSKYFDKKDFYSDKLDGAYLTISTIFDEINLLNKDIEEKLYPLDALGIKDRRNINSILNRYNALSAYDKTAIDVHSIETVLKAKAQIDSLILALWLTAGGIIISVGGIVFVMYNAKARKARKTALTVMPESDE